MDMTESNSPVKTKPSCIESNMQLIQDQIGRIESAVATLGKRLGPLLRQEPDIPGKDQVRPGQTCAFGLELNNQGERLLNVSRDLEGILEKLDF